MAKQRSIRLPRSAPAGLSILRDAHGVPAITAKDLDGMLWGLGYCHALDRGLQLLLTRVVAQGRTSECLVANAATLEVDSFFRRLNWQGDAASEIAKLDPEAIARLEAYAAGINARLSQRVPWEFRLVGYRPEAWTCADTIVLSRVMGYLGLAQTQGDLERLFIEMVQAGVDDARLKVLFPHIPELAALDGRDPRLPSRALLSRVRLGQRVVPAALRWLSPVPAASASNSWAIAPSKTRSGHALLACDPHLEVNRLPNVWYEISARLEDRPGHYLLAATIPGLPAPLLGRTAQLAWAPSYSFMDAVDSWIEECRDGCYRRGDQFVPFRVRREEIRRKQQPSVQLTFFENEHGVLDGDPNEAGLLLSTRWASAQSGAASLLGALQMWTAGSVDAGMAELGRIETAWVWTLADRAGNIACQMSGLLPKRRAGVSGFVPLPGWLSENDWQGFVPFDALPRQKNPASGFVVCANQDLSSLSAVQAQNATAADYRAERIRQLLEGRTDLSVEDCRAIQYDTYSLQAERFLQRLGPLLPDDDAGRLLGNWDFRYDRSCSAATLFERFYDELTQLILGRYLLGPDVVAHLSNATVLLTAYYGIVDRVLLNPPADLCAGRSRDDLYREAFARASQKPVGHWSEETQLTLVQLFFGQRLPGWTGFDRGPFSLSGGRATVFQTQFWQTAGRAGCLAPTLHAVADLGEDTLHTNLIGGPSDRRWSPWYCSGVDDWLSGRLNQRRI